MIRTRGQVLAPAVQGGERVAERGAPVQHVPSGPAAGDDAGVEQDAQVVADRSDRQPGAGSQVGGAGWLAEQAQQRGAVGAEQAVQPAPARTWLVEPLRFLLAAPYLLFFLHPALAPAAVLGFLASAGYAASLPLQERLISHTGAEVRGQVLGLNSTGVTAMQGVGAILAGLLTQRLHGGPAAAATAIGVMSCASLAVTLALIPGLRRSRPRRGRYDSGLASGAGGGPAAIPEDHRPSTLPSRQ
jgi:hypothetical protein